MPDYPADFGPLSSLLKQQLEQYTRLLTLAEEMKGSLTDHNIETLEKLVRAQTTQLKQLELLEKKRFAATEALCAALKLNGAPTLAELIPYAGAQQQDLQQLHQEFARLMPKLTAVQSANKALLHTNVELNDMMLNLMSEPEDPLNNFYGADGNEAEERIVSPSIFDQQI